MARHNTPSTSLRATLALALLFTHAFSGCSESSSSPDSFASAEEPEFELFYTPPPPPPPPLPPPPPPSTLGRVVEEGNIYRTLGDGILLNLNVYRGLQLIDISDISQPTIKSSLPVNGKPVEMYVVGEQAILLVDLTWNDYQAQPGSTEAEIREGSLVMLVDIADRNAPRVLDRAHVPGSILRSRLTQGTGEIALYVAATGMGVYAGDGGESTYGQRTVIQSFALVGNELAYRTELELDGILEAIQATPEVLLVARPSPDYLNSSVTVVDIADPRGTMRLRGSVTATGFVSSQFQMDYRNSMLRVFSSAQGMNQLQIWDFAGESMFPLLDEASFGQNESLYGTLFVGDKAFAVTYLRVDPFHAFSIAVNGEITEESEFIVSGWNDFFHPVMNDTRLIGIGINDEEGRQVAVSLYDITNLANPEPLITRAEVGSGSGNGWNWSEGNRDHRGFTVVENAVSVTAPTGELETGLILLPFQGWEENGSDTGPVYTAAVQIFTFSATTLTRRGVMDHGSNVLRTFPGSESTALNLSDVMLSAFDYTQPDAPAEVSRLEVAPNYTALLTFGAYRARLKNPPVDSNLWDETTPATVDIISVTEDPETAIPVASLEVPAGAGMFQSGNLLIAVGNIIGRTDAYTHIQIFDLSEPTNPVRLGELEAAELSWKTPVPRCPECWTWDDAQDLPVHQIGNALVFTGFNDTEGAGLQSELCVTYVSEQQSCGDEERCTFLAGHRECRALPGYDRYCVGGFAECVAENGSEPVCTPIALEDIQIPLTGSCDIWPGRSNTRRLSVHVLDFSNPQSPELHEIAIPEGYIGVNVRASDETLYIVLKKVFAAADPRPYSHYYAMPVDLGSPGNPVVEPMLYLPGELLAARGDDLYTRHKAWKDGLIETSIVHLRREGRQVAWIDAQPFPGRRIDRALVDESGKIVVTHRSVWWLYADYQQRSRFPRKLTVLSEVSGGMAVQSEVDVNEDLPLIGMANGRAFFDADGGLLVMSILDATRPVLQAFLPMLYWPQTLVLDGEGGGGNDLLIPAGHHGIYRLGPDDFTLSPLTE